MVRYLSNSSPIANASSGDGDGEYVLPDVLNIASLNASNSIITPLIENDANLQVRCTSIAPIAGLDLGIDASSLNTTGPVACGTILSANQVTTTNDMVVGRNLFTNLDIIKEVVDDVGAVSQIEYTSFKGCAKLTSGSIEYPQIFSGNNTFTEPTAAASITANGDIISSSGKIEATDGEIIGATASVAEKLTCRSIECSTGNYSQQEIKCGTLNLSSGGKDGWLVSQGEGGTNLQDALAFVPPNASGTWVVLDSAGNPSLQVSDSAVSSLRVPFCLLYDCQLCGLDIIM